MRLLNIRIFTPTLRRRMWIRWLPPIDIASPSPVAIHTSSSGRASLRPVAPAGGRAAGDRVEAERVHVVREAARAADPRHHHELLARDPQLGEDLLHRRED